MLALLLVKYCLLTGKADISSKLSVPWTNPKVGLGVDDAASLVLLCLGDECLLNSEVAASVDIGSTGVSIGGP